MAEGSLKIAEGSSKLAEGSPKLAEGSPKLAEGSSKLAEGSELIAKVVQANMLTTWQDLGRRHSTHHGVGQGGVMDIHAAYWANRLLSRAISQPVLEITLGLFSLEFRTACQIAITGADMNASLNGASLELWQCHAVKAGDQLKFTTANSGLRSYLAINAELSLETVFNSASTVIREQFNGSLGRAIRVGDQVTGVVTSSAMINKQMPSSFIPDYAQPLTLELIPGYQFEQFPRRSIDALLNNEYQIQSNSSRMAYLLKAEPIQHAIEVLASQGIAYGAVQVPPDGQAVVLLNDRQTMGGYPMLGCVSRLSGAALAQRFAPSKVRFELTSVESAKSRYREFVNFFRQP